MDDSRCFLLWLLWMAFCIWAWWRAGKGRHKVVSDAWLLLAERTGLTFSRGRGPSLLGAWDAKNGPSVTGVYRGRLAKLSMTSHWIGMHDSSAPLAYTLMAFEVSNPSQCALSTHGQTISFKLPGDHANPDAIGWVDAASPSSSAPPELERRATQLVEPLLRQRETKGMNRSPFFWTSAPRVPVVRLEGSNLTWQQYDAVLDAEELRGLLEQMSALAELVEAS